MDTIRGYVEHITFRNEENGYTVLNLVSGDEEITLVGIFHIISEGENIEATGTYTTHPTYGKQFKVESFTEKAPQDIIAIERYLGSGAVKGLGAVLAARIVRKFGTDTFRIIQEEPERLSEVKGISERKAREIAVEVESKRELREAMIFLQKYGISLTLAVKIYHEYGQKVYRILTENPYKMADDIPGVGFKIADEIAVKVGIHTDSDFRIRSGIQYALLQGSLDGHTYLPKEELLRRAVELLGVPEEAVEQHFMDLAIDKKIVIKGENIYSSMYYYTEVNVAQRLLDLNISYDVPDVELEHTIRKIEKSTGMDLDELQADAVKEALRNGLMILTGGPGTGKTTTINAIIKYFEMEGMDIFLGAPTGRAAKRMSETTGYEAKTIHRMLELSGGVEEKEGFERNEENPLEADVIIIDEMSMVDITLMNALLKAIAKGTRLVLVGDVNQLPSVGPGSVLKDIIESGTCHVVKLNKIFRQASQSDIIVNAHKINNGQQVLLDNKSMDFFFLKRYDADVVISIVIQLIREKLPKFVDASMFDIQVLTPMRKGLLGVERLNKILQQYLNPASKEKEEVENRDGILREGDKIMQTRNNYQMEWQIKSKYGLIIEKGLGVFNGDMGIVKEINKFTEIVTIEFDEGRQAEYAFKDLEELELAYAITIHKSQGSEYPAVVIPLLNGPKMLMNRNLLYTAVTRARKCVTLVGDENTFFEMARNEKRQQRYSGLKERLMEIEEGMGEDQ